MRKGQLLSPQRWSDHLIGVVDLKDSVAVHGVAGNRDRYRPVQFCDGNCEVLACHYRDLGIRSLYLADLNALEGGEVQWGQYQKILDLGFKRLMIDIGWREGRQHFGKLSELTSSFPEIQWIVATESCRSLDDYEVFLEQVGPDRACLSLDFADGKFLNHSSDWRSWVQFSHAKSVRDLIVLDLASVGTSRGVATAVLCQGIKADWPSIRIFSGGGIRSNHDLETLFDAGCHGVLAASALFPPVRIS